MAKDTEKLIRQLSLISFLMAQGRPVSALEIKREVEGYSVMNEDAFARRFYADRAELDSLGIELQVDRPGEGFFEAELYSLPPENFYLPAIEFSDDELAALRTSLSLLTEGEFAYAEPLRLALQQVAWGHPNPLVDPDNTPISMAKFASTSSRELTQRLARIETAISRHKTVNFEYHTIQRDEVSERKVDPYHLVFRGGQFYLIGYSHEREAVRREDVGDRARGAQLDRRDLRECRQRDQRRRVRQGHGHRHGPPHRHRQVEQHVGADQEVAAHLSRRMHTGQGDRSGGRTDHPRGD